MASNSSDKQPGSTSISEALDLAARSVPKRYKAAKLTDFPDFIQNQAAPWANDPKEFLCIHGPCGCGKTRLAAAIVRQIATNGTKAFLSNASEIMLKLRGSFQSQVSTEEEIIAPYMKNIHIFDDVAAHKLSDYALETWYRVINFRYNNLLPTGFVGNLNLQEISDSMGDRIASRMESGIVVKMVGKDWRTER